MSLRRKARELALQILFQWDALKDRNDDPIHNFFHQYPAVSSVRDFAMLLVKGVVEHRTEIDQVIQENTEHWSLERMAIVDRNILRFALYELLYLDEIPVRVTLNEAIEIAKRFGTEDSGGFVNGILDKVLQSDKRAAHKLEIEQRGVDASQDRIAKGY
jgi:transcription antitermination factor NusB